MNPLPPNITQFPILCWAIPKPESFSTHLQFSLTQEGNSPLTKLNSLISQRYWFYVDVGKEKSGRRMLGDLLTWLLSLFTVIALISLVVYQLVCLADLEFDYINPYDSAARINKVMLPEFITQGALSCLYLLTGHWFMCLLSTPYLYYNFRTYMDRDYLIDVTEIFNLLNWEKKRRLFKLGYLVILLFLSLFWLIWSTLEDYEEL